MVMLRSRTPRGRGQNGHQKPYYRKQRGYWDNKNSNQVSPTNNSSQEEKNLNTSGSSDDYIPFNNSLPSPFNKELAFTLAGISTSGIQHLRRFSMCRNRVVSLWPASAVLAWE
ncbi:hypothetical protein KQX54_000616 [Cotesia glomerata]|uniref:Uncharacterized protein n=1 Tax=Cotesia glomerata TaxID=32391 RepID=A0AAV7IED8_COTGL|nr:hypothetical protein KQX54_000616 [Cotesia glomerata]